MSTGVLGGGKGARSLPSRPGVRLAGTGTAVPATRLTNADLEAIMETSDEWITQRTGIRARHVHKVELGETTSGLAIAAARSALSNAGMEGSEVDLVVVATMTPDSPTPTVSCGVASAIRTGHAAALDLNGACSGFVYGLNVAHDLMRAGSYRAALVIGADRITRHLDYSTRGRATSVLFGDGAGAVVLRATDDASKGIIAQAMHSDGEGSRHLFIPYTREDFPPEEEFEEHKINRVQMNGAAVFKFAVGTFSVLIERTLSKAGLSPEQVDHYVCHQSNARILEAARERFGIPGEKMPMNIDRYGNTVAASVPLAFDEIRRTGRVREGQKVMFLAFGAGLTWGSSLWQL
ncbi:MAG: ketoacyl-ACP synthase III [Phycisphaeraceae bacterium]|nr:ketoacyl-ACP synthase III [Phycisphaerae bacterium]MBX3391258.1 ketoacyl-ACP synthase III [Phycisphaeraceae bacterium]